MKCSVQSADTHFTETLSVVIPTYGRDTVLLDTIAALLEQQPMAEEILVVDQTPQHDAVTQSQLERWSEAGAIRWIRLAEPSITRAMNRGLLEAQGALVLFVDDDIRPEPDFIGHHLAAHREWPGVIVAGRVIQPWQEGQDFSADTEFHFAATRPAWIEEFMEGNFSLSRTSALAIGGFDENFIKVAYRFGAEFSHRWLASGRRIRYVPEACIHHLKVASGGTRTFGEHLTTARPDHSVGGYYFLLRTQSWRQVVPGVLLRLLRSVTTRYHLRHPWRIPVTWVAELRGLLQAIRLARAGPRYVEGVKGFKG